MSWLFCFNCVALVLQMYRSLQWPTCHLYCTALCSSCTLVLLASLSSDHNTTSYSHFAWLEKPDTFSVCPGGPIPHHRANALQLCRLTLPALYLSEHFFMLLITRLLSQLISGPHSEPFQHPREGRGLSGDPTCRQGTWDPHRLNNPPRVTQEVYDGARNWNRIFSITVWFI